MYHLRSLGLVLFIMLFYKNFAFLLIAEYFVNFVFIFLLEERQFMFNPVGGRRYVVILNFQRRRWFRFDSDVAVFSQDFLAYRMHETMTNINVHIFAVRVNSEVDLGILVAFFNCDHRFKIGVLHVDTALVIHITWIFLGEAPKNLNSFVRLIVMFDPYKERKTLFRNVDFHISTFKSAHFKLRNLILFNIFNFLIW
jgi:hypothetical protein